MTTYSSITYTGDGTTKDFTVTFEYLDTADVSVSVDGVATTDVGALFQFSFTDSTTVRITKIADATAPANDAVVTLTRTTPITTQKVVFNAGSTVTADNLNRSDRQKLFGLQEASDDAANGIRLATDDKFDARSKVIKSVADPVNSNDAVNKGFFEGTFGPQLDAKVTAAQAAQAGAETAQSASETAQAASETAQSASETALDTLTDLYLGAKTANPTLDNDGDALQDGALYFNTTAQVFRGYDLGTTTWFDADDASASASAAAASAAAASASETAAATSETNAGASETAAATSETNAATSETNAGASETAAATSETNAATSATEASASAAEAESSAIRGSSRALFSSQFPGLPLSSKAITFLDGASGEGFTVARASTANTVFGQQRLMSTVSANVLRRHHKVTTGEPVGVLIEPQRTQLWLHANDLSNAAWVKLSATVSANQGKGPTGATDMDKLIPVAATGQFRVTQNVSAVSGKKYVFSGFGSDDGYEGLYVFLNHTDWNSSGTHVTAKFGLKTGSVLATTGAVVDSGIRHVGGGVFFWWLVAEASTTGSLPINLQPVETEAGQAHVFTGDGTKGILLGRLMAQQGSVPSSFIDSTTAQVTVDGDDLTLDPSGEDWHADDAQEGTWFLDLDVDWLRQNSGFLNIESASGEGFRVRNITGGDDVESADGALAATSKTIELTPLGSWFAAQTFTTITGERLRVAVAYDRTDIAFCVNGGTVVETALAADPPDDINDLHLGGESTSTVALVGTARQAAYWPAKLPDADLITLTTLPA